LAAKGLTPFRDGTAEDVAVVRESDGLLRPCGWLELGRHGGAPVAWLAGTAPGDRHAPPGWTPERRMQYVSGEEAKRRLEFVRSEDNVDVYRDKTTGKEYYVGRTAASRDADAARHDALYEKACGRIKGLILLDDRPPGPMDALARERLEDAVPLFEEVVRINPGNWAAMWLLGKVCQRFEAYERGLQWFARAHRVNPDQADVAREAAIAAMEAGRPEEAVAYCERAAAVKPEDAGLRANLALALLFSGRPAEARAAAGEALRRDPADTITTQVVKIVDEVLAGARPCPHHVRDLE